MCPADEKLLDWHLKTFIQNNVIDWDGQEGWDWLKVKDAAKTSCIYKMWIGKEDLLVRRMEVLLTMGIDQKKMPEQDLPAKIEVKWSIAVSDYDTNLDVTVPEQVQQRFGITDETK